MKKRVTIALFLGLVGTAMAEPGQGREGQGGPGHGFGRFFKHADSNGDGVVTMEEFEQLERVAKLPEDARLQLYQRFDKNNDGRIERHEMKPPRRPHHGGPMLEFRKLDADGDGRVSLEEFRNSPFGKRVPEDRVQAFFERLDQDKDGWLSPADRQRGRGGPDRRPERRRAEGPERPFELLDADGDRAVSFEEFRAAPWVRHLAEDEQEARFDSLDRNGDLKLDRDELRPPKRGNPKGRPFPGGPAR